MPQPDTVPMRILRAEIGEELAQLLEGRSRSKLDAGAGVVGLETQACADLVRRVTEIPSEILREIDRRLLDSPRVAGEPKGILGDNA